MEIDFTLFVFVECVDTGGSAEKLALIWAQANKVYSTILKICE